MSSCKIDVSGLEAFQKKLEKSVLNNIDELIEDCTKVLAAELLRRSQQKTIEVTGNLIKGWTAGEKEEANEFIKRVDIEQSGNEYTIIISNPVEYSVYKEYGHVTRDRQKWVKGDFMLTLSAEEVNAMKQGLINEELTKFIEKVWKS